MLVSGTRTDFTVREHVASIMAMSTMAITSVGNDRDKESVISPMEICMLETGKRIPFTALEGTITTMVTASRVCSAMANGMDGESIS